MIVIKTLMIFLLIGTEVELTFIEGLLENMKYTFYGYKNKCLHFVLRKSSFIYWKK